MGGELNIIVTFLIFIGLLAAGMTVPFAITIPALIYLVLEGGFSALNSIGLVSWGSMNSFALTAVPLFMLMAEVLSESGLSGRIYSGLSKLLVRLPGGLLQTNIAGCAVFSSVSGSSVATAGTIGSVALPELLSRRYSRTMSAGSLAAGGTLGILIPPSFAMIIYGTFTDTSVPKLFMAGLVPGLLMTAAFMLYIAYFAWRNPAVAPREAGAQSSEMAQALFEIMPFAILILGTFGSLYTGIATTTEAAAIGTVLALILGATFGTLRWSGIRKALVNTVLLTGNILFLVLAAYIFRWRSASPGSVKPLPSGWLVLDWRNGSSTSRCWFFSRCWDAWSKASE